MADAVLLTVPDGGQADAPVVFVSSLVYAIYFVGGTCPNFIN